MENDPKYLQTINELLKFRNEKAWEKYHTLENLTKSVSIETSEMLEHFEWTTESNLSDEEKKDYQLEVADVLTYLYYICYQLDKTPNELVMEKLSINHQRTWKI